MSSRQTEMKNEKEMLVRSEDVFSTVLLHLLPFLTFQDRHKLSQTSTELRHLILNPLWERNALLEYIKLIGVQLKYFEHRRYNRYSAYYWRHARRRVGQLDYLEDIENPIVNDPDVKYPWVVTTTRVHRALESESESIRCGCPVALSNPFATLIPGQRSYSWISTDLVHLMGVKIKCCVHRRLSGGTTPSILAATDSRAASLKSEFSFQDLLEAFSALAEALWLHVQSGPSFFPVIKTLLNIPEYGNRFLFNDIYSESAFEDWLCLTRTDLFELDVPEFILPELPPIADIKRKSFVYDRSYEEFCSWTWNAEDLRIGPSSNIEAALESDVQSARKRWLRDFCTHKLALEAKARGFGEAGGGALMWCLPPNPRNGRNAVLSLLETGGGPMFCVAIDTDRIY
eukprot:Blabericola_migrator_1__2628@NODE_1743_length_3879_cov_123_753410_g203_i2_p1_GENE_NODE_1743_length_3879_cov_123_753410_g203_i2NODE_1743_length_3879_cov_123_753410_g203_i2_p1_ORF_typecomplete_len400_score26_82RepC/PF06504_11/0_048Fboxlike/PF12937_7/0_22_NODE_1743_length_3879_cov_123_753410_g203_i225113710